MKAEDLHKLYQHIQDSREPLYLEDKGYLFSQVPTKDATAIYGDTYGTWKELGICSPYKRLDVVAIATNDGKFYYSDANIDDKENINIPNSQSFEEFKRDVYSYLATDYIPKLKELKHYKDLQISEIREKYAYKTAKRLISSHKLFTNPFPYYPYDSITHLLLHERYLFQIIGKEKTADDLVNDYMKDVKSKLYIFESLKEAEIISECLENPHLVYEDWELELFDTLRELRNAGAKTLSITFSDNAIYRYDLVEFAEGLARDYFKYGKSKKDLEVISYKGKEIFNREDVPELQLQDSSPTMPI